MKCCNYGTSWPIEIEVWARKSRGNTSGTQQETCFVKSELAVAPIMDLKLDITSKLKFSLDIQVKWPTFTKFVCKYPISYV
jgi:hypothetical protein